MHSLDRCVYLPPATLPLSGTPHPCKEKTHSHEIIACVQPQSFLIMTLCTYLFGVSGALPFFCGKKQIFNIFLVVTAL